MSLRSVACGKFIGIAAYAASGIWTVAVEGLRQAILIGRHDGFGFADDVLIERRQKLRELVKGKAKEGVES